MDEYSLLRNLKYMGWAIYHPKLLINKTRNVSNIWYGIVPFLIYISICEIGWISAYQSGTYRAINPLPKLLPISDAQYPLYQAIFGPFVKAMGVFIFLGIVYLLARALELEKIPIVPLSSFYLIVGNTLALVAITVDMVIIWYPFCDSVRFALSMIHPIVFVIATIYVVAFFRRIVPVTLLQSIVVVLPGMILSGPVPGLIFR